MQNTLKKNNPYSPPMKRTQKTCTNTFYKRTLTSGTPVLNKLSCIKWKRLPNLIMLDILRNLGYGREVSTVYELFFLTKN